MQDALVALESGFDAEKVETLYRAAHSLSGTAGRFGGDDLSDVAGDLEQLARDWVQRGGVLTDERRAAAAALHELDGAARGYRPPAVVGGGAVVAAPGGG